ncbi:unnamed protein product [Rotaria sordida]|uniref:Uncharacterized protein n=1 Tax=Rotaria sordida TaxID=392033 RepID=A0A815ALT8_9BILA|nr:unnamed protein product [Rotaria sordida]CAF4013032.1 unnamed protein product [Rotaria sordida]
MKALKCRSAFYKQRVRSSAAFNNFVDYQQTENNDSVRFTFGDDAQGSSTCNTNNFDDNDNIKELAENYVMSESSSLCINAQNELEKCVGNNQCDDIEDGYSIKSCESEYFTVHSTEHENLKNISLLRYVEYNDLSPTSVHLGVTLIQIMHRHHLIRAYLLILPLADQLRPVIINSNFSFIKQKSQSDVLMDITDGDRYKQIQKKETDRFLTLTLYVDGVQIAKLSSKSLWMFTLALNKLPCAQQFKQHNLVVAATAFTGHRPSRSQMQVILQIIVRQLKRLENGLLIEFGSQHEEIIPIYLISASCDKSAQALVQN